MSVTIIHKKGSGIPSADSLQVAEIAVDVVTGKLYTKTGDGNVVEISGSGDGGGLVHIGEAPPPDPQEGQEWLKLPADGSQASMWVYDGEKWLQQPSNGSGGGGASVHIGEAPPVDPQEGEQWLETPADGDAAMWVWDGEKWLQHPSGGSGGDIDTSNLVQLDQQNDVAEGDFSLVWDDSNDPDFPFNGRIGYDGRNNDPDSVGGSFLYAKGIRGTVSIGRDGDMELHGPSEIKGMPDRDDARPWITNFSYVQAGDFLDDDGNSIIGGDSLNFYDEVVFGDSQYQWTVENFWSHEKFDVEVEYVDRPTEKHVFGYIEARRISGFDLGITASSISLGMPESGGPSYFANGTGPSFFRDAISIENTVFGGINILGADAERPPELPYSPDEKSVQYALTVSHETLGRTVEIDKEGIIRAHQFTDMDGNPIGGGGDYLPVTRGDFPSQYEDVEDILIADESFAGTTIYANQIEAKNLRCWGEPVSAKWGLEADILRGAVSGGFMFATEYTAFGGINITALDQERPEELPFDTSDDELAEVKAKARSVQHALTVTHETLGRTVEIDKEGIIRANQFTDMAGNPMSVSPATMVDAFTTLQTAIADEDTLEGVKTALTNALGGLIEKFEAYQVKQGVKK